MQRDLELTVLLTVYKRDNIKEQLLRMQKQTLQPAKYVIFQNEDHVRVPKIEELRGTPVELIKKKENTKYFGRFEHLIGEQTENFAVLDDDILPGKNFFSHYRSIQRITQGIVGGNGRIGINNPNRAKLTQPRDYGPRFRTYKVDFVGHAWFFGRRPLEDMLKTEPLTKETGEDMHLCMSAYINSRIESFVAGQILPKNHVDVTFNKLATDQFASYRTTPKPMRQKVEEHLVRLGYSYVGSRE